MFHVKGNCSSEMKDREKREDLGYNSCPCIHIGGWGGINVTAVLQCCFNSNLRTSLMLQWIRIRLPMQGRRVWSLVWEDPKCRGTTKLSRGNCWSPQVLGPVLCTKRTPRWEAHAPQQRGAFTRHEKKSRRSNRDPAQPKTNKQASHLRIQVKAPGTLHGPKTFGIFFLHLKVISLQLIKINEK